MASSPRVGDISLQRSRARSVLVSAVLALMFLSPIIPLSSQVASDPGVVDNGDYTKSVFWNFTDSSSYLLSNATVSGGLGMLQLVNDSVVEDTTAQYLLGTAANIDLQAIADGLVINDTSLAVQTMTLQPAAEGDDNYLDEWFPAWCPDTNGLTLNPEYDPVPSSSHRARIVMHFDLSAVPAGATVVDARLWLYERPSKADPIVCTFHALNASFDDTTVSWRSPWGKPGGDFSVESFLNVTIDGANGWHDFDMTRLVDLWTRGAIANHGFIIVPRNEDFDGSKNFVDGDVTNKPEERPKLVLNYTLGTVNGTYESQPLGPGTNTTFTLANWTDGIVSKATDEFSGPTLSRWNWTNDPTMAGGSLNFDRPGWLNVTGSQQTILGNESQGCNYLHQNITGNFRAEMSLQGYFSADAMGAGLLIRSDSLAWLAFYSTGIPGNGALVIKAFNGSAISTLFSVPWTATNAFLRIDRVVGTYQLFSSPDGAAWTTVFSFTPVFDFRYTVTAGLCVFSGGLASNPVVEFDFFRIQRIGQNPTASMKIRTGNSTSLADPSWQPWGTSVSPSSGCLINQTGQYLQYQVTLETGWEWLSPTFSGLTFHHEHYLPGGTISTLNLYPIDLESWDTMTVIQDVSSGRVEYSYSSDAGNSWQSLGTGSSFALGISQPSMMLRMVFTSFDGLTTPTIDSIELVYSVSITSFRVTGPSSGTAGEDFPMTIEALDPLGNTATAWNGTVALQALDATGTYPAPGVLNVTSAYVPLGGMLALWSQGYNLAATIRILVTAGSVSGISAPITIRAGAAASLTLEPANATMFEDTSESFTATARDQLGNIIEDATYTWTVEASLGTLNSTSGRVVQLTVGARYTEGFLNVSYGGILVSRWIDVVPTRFAPTFTSSLPDQVKDEDSGDWTLDMSAIVTDIEDAVSNLSWFATNESIVTVHGENITGNLVITFSTIDDVFGSAYVNIFVVDSDGMWGMTTVYVEIMPVNDAPTFDLVDPLVVRYGVAYVYDLTHYIHDSDNSYSELTLSVDSESVPYTRTDDTMSITFIYPQSLEGATRSVIVTVIDLDGGYSSTAILVTVSADQPPLQNQMLPGVELDEGTTLEDCALLADYFHDPDGDPLTYEALCDHSTIGISSEGVLNVTAPTDWYGVEYAIIRAVDPSGARAEGAMRITVRQVNYPPVIAGVPDLMVHYDYAYTIDLAPYVSDSDEEFEAMTYSADDHHCTFTGSVMTVYYPIGMNNTVNNVTITVSDGGLSDSCMIYITVSANYPPGLSSGTQLPDHSFQEDIPTQYPMAYGLEHYFWDQEDMEMLMFEVFSLNSNITAHASDDGLYNWKVDFATPPDYYGASSFVIRAIDSEGAIFERTIALDVVPVPDAPRLSFPDVFNVTEGQQTIMNLVLYVTDPDSSFESQDFTFQIAAVGDTGSDTDDYLDYIRILPGVFVFDFPVDFVDHGKAKTFDVEITVTDQDGKVATTALTITVEKVASKSDSLMLIAMLATAGVAAGMFVVMTKMRRKPFVIRDMMLIHNDGFLIGRYAGHSHIEGEIDEDILSGMLTAVLNFVEDSMISNQDGLKTFGFKEFQVLVKRANKFFAAIVFEGDLPDNIDGPLSDFLGTFERVYKKKIMDWTGDIDTDFAGVEVLIKSFVKEHSKRSKKKQERLWVSKKESGGATAK